MRIPGRRAALDLLHRLAGDPTNMDELRRIHGATRGVPALPGRSDREILEQLAARLGAGSLEIVGRYEAKPTIVLVGSGAEEKPKAKKPSQKTAPAPKPEPNPQVTLIGWSKPRVGVGEKIQAVFAVTGFEGGESATITITEHDGSGAQKQAAKVSATVDKPEGEIRVDWSRSEDEASADLEEDRAAGDSKPVEYRFKVKAGKVTAAGESGPLWLTHTVEVKLEAEGDGEVPDGIKVTLWDALGEEVVTKAKSGKAKFEKVLVGPFQIAIGGPPSPFSDLRWSAPKVEVGAEVEASFAFQGLEDGQEVIVRVVECNADGSATLVESVTTKVSGESGEHKVKWKRSEDGAKADALQDEEEGDSGPVEYRFELRAGDKKSDERSGPLWLTHAVEVSLGLGADKKPIEDGLELKLTAADGAEHKAKTSGGKARFEGVVVGPFVLSLAGEAG